MHKARLPLIVFLGWTLAGGAPSALAQCSAQAGNYINRGNAYLNSRHYQEAIQQYEEALKIDPACGVAKLNLAEGYNHWGMSYYSQRKYREAIGEFQKALEIVPNHANAKRNISIVNQAAAQQGIDLNAADVDAPEGNGGTAAATGGPAPETVATFDPLTGAPITKQGGSAVARKQPLNHGGNKPAVAAKSVFLQGGTSSSAGSASPPATVAGTVETPHAVDTEPPGAMMLTPGLRVGSPPSPPAAGDSFSSAGGPVSAVDTTRPATSAAGAGSAENYHGVPSYAENGGKSGSSPLRFSIGAESPAYRATSGNDATVSGAQAAPAPTTINMSSDINMVTPQLPAPSSKPAPAAASVPPPSAAPALPAATSAPAPVAVHAPSGGTSVEDQLNAVEMKMYGQPQGSLTVFQRLEKMERDVSGQPRSGNIIERINFLKQNIGM